MRVVLCGSRTFGAQALELLLERGDEVDLVVSPAARDLDLPGYAEGPTDRLAGVALGYELPWVEAARFTADLVPEGTDLIVAAHAHNFVSAKARHRALLGGIGYHPSLLPRHRGRDAVRWTVHMGDPIAGGSVYWLTNGVDAGPIAAQDWCHVPPGTTAQALWRERLSPMGLRLLGNVLADLDDGAVVKMPQDEAVATWEPSWSRPPLHRPDLLALGPMPDGYRVVAAR